MYSIWEIFDILVHYMYVIGDFILDLQSLTFWHLPKKKKMQIIYQFIKVIY